MQLAFLAALQKLELETGKKLFWLDGISHCIFGNSPRLQNIQAAYEESIGDYIFDKPS